VIAPNEKGRDIGKKKRRLVASVRYLKLGVGKNTQAQKKSWGKPHSSGKRRGSQVE